MAGKRVAAIMDRGSLPPQLSNLVRTFIGRRTVLSTIYLETARSVKIVVEQLSSQRLRRLYSESEGPLPEHINVYTYNSRIREQGKSLLADVLVYEDKLLEAEKMTRRCAQLMLWNSRERLCYLGGHTFYHGNHNDTSTSTTANQLQSGRSECIGCRKMEVHSMEICGAQCAECCNSLLKEAHTTVSRLKGVKFVPSNEDEQLGFLEEYNIAHGIDYLCHVVVEEDIQRFLSDCLVRTRPNPLQQVNDVNVPSVSGSEYISSGLPRVFLEPHKHARAESSIQEITLVAKELLMGDAIARKSNMGPLWTVEQDVVSFPEGISFLQNGRLAVADSARGHVAVCDSNGRVVRHFHRKQVTKLLGDWHFKPQCLAALKDGSVAVTDMQNRAVNIFDPDGNCVVTLHEGNCRHPEGAFNPFGIAVTPSGDFVLTHCDDHITIHSPDGVPKVVIKSDGDFWYVTTDIKGRILVSDCHHHRIKVFSCDGKHLQSFGCRGVQDGQLQYPHGLCIDSRGNTLVADSINNRVCRFSPDGRFTDYVLRGKKHVKWPRDISAHPQGHIAVAWGHNVTVWGGPSAKRETDTNFINMLTTYL